MLKSDEGEINPVDILRWPGVMAAKEQDLDAIADILAALIWRAGRLHPSPPRNGRPGPESAYRAPRLEGVSGEVAKVRAHMPEISPVVVAKLEDAEVQLEKITALSKSWC